MADRLAVHGAVRRFGADAGLFGASLTVAAGEIHALVGLNGAGKTTLLRALLGMLRLDSGAIEFDGVPLARLPRRAWARVGHAVDQPFAYPDLTLRTNLRLAARLRGLPPARISTTVDDAITELDLDRFADVLARRLSQGNRQRLGLAAALLHHPELIVLDEPTNGLDPAGVILLRNALRARAERGAGVLVSSHHLDEVARTAHRISVLNHGRIIGGLAPGGAELEQAFFRAIHADDERRAA